MSGLLFTIYLFYLYHSPGKFVAWMAFEMKNGKIWVSNNMESITQDNECDHTPQSLCCVAWQTWPLKYTNHHIYQGWPQVRKTPMDKREISLVRVIGMTNTYTKRNLQVERAWPMRLSACISEEKKINIWEPNEKERYKCIFNNLVNGHHLWYSLWFPKYFIT